MAFLGPGRLSGLLNVPEDIATSSCYLSSSLFATAFTAASVTKQSPVTALDRFHQGEAVPGRGLRSG